MSELIKRLVSRHGIISDQVEVKELTTILSELLTVSNRPGAIVEFGCYVGTTSLYIRRLLNEANIIHDFHVYDSFEGLPPKLQQDVSPLGEQFKAGELSVSKKEFVRQFQKENLELPVIHKGWFEDLSSCDVPGNIIFAFLDGDYYQSIKIPLGLIESKLATGAVIIVDDYMNQALPGAAKATDEWCSMYGYKILKTHSLAIIRT